MMDNHYIADAFKILCVVCGLILGFLLPFQWNSHIEGFKGGVVIGSPFIILLALFYGSLVGKVAEDLFGLAGMPVGLFVGCFTGAFALNYLGGKIGQGIGALVRRIDK